MNAEPTSPDNCVAIVKSLPGCTCHSPSSHWRLYMTGDKSASPKTLTPSASGVDVACGKVSSPLSTPLCGCFVSHLALCCRCHAMESFGCLSKASLGALKRTVYLSVWKFRVEHRLGTHTPAHAHTMTGVQTTCRALAKSRSHQTQGKFRSKLVISVVSSWKVALSFGNSGLAFVGIGMPKMALKCA